MFKSDWLTVTKREKRSKKQPNYKTRRFTKNPRAADRHRAGMLVKVLTKNRVMPDRTEINLDLRGGRAERAREKNRDTRIY